VRFGKDEFGARSAEPPPHLAWKWFSDRRGGSRNLALAMKIDIHHEPGCAGLRGAEHRLVVLAETLSTASLKKRGPD
jgi:hypothetical protein